MQAKTIKISAVVNEQKSAEELQEQNDQLLFENSRLTAQLKTLQAALQGDSLSQASRGVLKQALKAAAGKAEVLDKPTKQTVRIADLRLLKSRLEACLQLLTQLETALRPWHRTAACACGLSRCCDKTQMYELSSSYAYALHPPTEREIVVVRAASCFSARNLCSPLPLSPICGRRRFFRFNKNRWKSSKFTLQSSISSWRALNCWRSGSSADRVRSRVVAFSSSCTTRSIESSPSSAASLEERSSFSKNAVMAADCGRFCGAAAGTGRTYDSSAAECGRWRDGTAAVVTSPVLTSLVAAD